MIKKVDLQIECPAMHIIVEVTEVRITSSRLILGFPPEVFGELLRQSSLASTYIASDSKVLDMGFGSIQKKTNINIFVSSYIIL